MRRGVCAGGALVSVAEFFATHAIDGRATIQGQPENPERWIARIENTWGDVSYWHCQSNELDIIALDPQAEARVLLGFRALGGRPRKPS